MLFLLTKFKLNIRILNYENTETLFYKTLIGFLYFSFSMSLVCAIKTICIVMISFAFMFSNIEY